VAVDVHIVLRRDRRKVRKSFLQNSLLESVW
jgi:hypothetical protein